MNEYLRLFTQARHSYIVRLSDGCITQYNYTFTDPSLHKFSGGWKFLGLSHVKQNWIISLQTICNSPEILDKINLLYKNGKGQYTVRDLDHGTIREWGDRVISIGWITK